ncbi:MAG: hypothetical protein V9G19_14750 [Tetrasphaera sp.]
MPTNAPRKVAVSLAIAGSTLVGVVGLAQAPAGAIQIPGTPGRDVHIGADNDNANNAFIQPPGVTAKQHMDNTDVLFGRGGDDLLIGRLGGDTLIGNGGSDILVGGPENFVAPNSDVLLGEEGDDINIWAPGDGSDAFVGFTGRDTMIFAPFTQVVNGTPKLESYNGRKIPRVKIDASPQFSCTIVKVPASQNLGFDFLVRFNVNGVPAVTVRQEGVETVYCPSPHAGQALVANLTVANPTFSSVALSHIPGTVGAILAPSH